MAELRDLMQENPALSEALLEAVSKANEIETTGKADEAKKIYLESWDKLPEPKAGWTPFSQWIANCLFNNHMDSGQFVEAKKWAEVSYASRPSEIDSASVMYMGMANFELGDLDAAFDWFSKAYGIGKDRAFRDFDKKYLKFYKSRK